MNTTSTRKRLGWVFLLGVYFVSVFPVVASDHDNQQKLKKYVIPSFTSVTDLNLCIKKNGQIFFFNGSHESECSKSDRFIALHLGGSGTSGSVGATGATGIMGPMGNTGPKGSDGTNGQDGSMGPTGPSGLGETGATGAIGATGSQGATGPVGENGQNGVSGYEIVTTSDTSTTNPKTLVATCPNGKKVIAGGFTASTQSIQVKQNYPSSQNEWTVFINKTTASSEWTATVYATCVSAL